MGPAWERSGLGNYLEGYRRSAAAGHFHPCRLCLLSERSGPANDGLRKVCAMGRLLRCKNALLAWNARCPKFAQHRFTSVTRPQSALS